MPIQNQINGFINGLAEPKQSDIKLLHSRILQMFPKIKLWYLDGRDNKGKIVSNPNIGYGLQTIKYSNGTSKEFYRVGISPNTTGISVYLMGIEDKTYLNRTYGKKLGKAGITGYCIKFKTLRDININILEEAVSDCILGKIAN